MGSIPTPNGCNNRVTLDDCITLLWYSIYKTVVEELFFYCVINIVSKGDNLMPNMNKKRFAKKMRRKKLKDICKSRPPL